MVDAAEVEEPWASAFVLFDPAVLHSVCVQSTTCPYGFLLCVCCHVPAVNQARVTGPAGSVVVTFIDLCYECANGHIDVTPPIFDILTGDRKIGKLSAVGKGISWEFI